MGEIKMVTCIDSRGKTCQMTEVNANNASFMKKYGLRIAAVPKTPTPTFKKEEAPEPVADPVTPVEGKEPETETDFSQEHKDLLAEPVAPKAENPAKASKPKQTRTKKSTVK